MQQLEGLPLTPSQRIPLTLPIRGSQSKSPQLVLALQHYSQYHPQLLRSEKTSSSIAGSTDASPTKIITAAGTAPAVTAWLAFGAASSPSGNITSNDALIGTGLPNAVVHFMIDGAPTGATVTADAEGTWSFKPAGLADGPHTILASQTDILGNTGTASLSFILDTTAPSGSPPNPIAASDTGSSNSDNITCCDGADLW